MKRLMTVLLIAWLALQIGGLTGLFILFGVVAACAFWGRVVAVLTSLWHTTEPPAEAHFASPSLGMSRYEAALKAKPTKR